MIISHFFIIYYLLNKTINKYLIIKTKKIKAFLKSIQQPITPTR